MILRSVVLPLVLVAGLAFALAPDAEAGPITGIVQAPNIHAGPVHVAVGVGVRGPVVPVRRHHAGHRYRVRPAGRWVIQDEHVWVPGEMIGYDSHGHEIYTEGRWIVERRRVWVPAPRVIHHHHRRGYVRPRTRGYVRVGAHFH